jgi:hypothetical protein
MNKNLLIIFIIFLFGCKDDKISSSEVESSTNEIDEEYGMELDSLGFPTHYTHPEITKISQLEELLLMSDKVLAYNFNENNGNSANVECYDLYDSAGICPSAVNEQTLNTNQISKLIEITCDSTTYDGNWSGLSGVCFIPHMGFGFFKKDSLIAQVNICFICSGIRTRPYYHSDGLTKAGGLKYIELAKELELKIVDGSEKLNY